LQCLVSDLELIQPAAQTTQKVLVTASVVDSDGYWQNECHHHSGMTVEKLERKAIAMARVQARIEQRRAALAATIQPHEFSVSQVQESLQNDAERRLNSQACFSLSTSDYWSEQEPDSKHIRMIAQDRDDYWLEPTGYSDGQTADRLEQRDAVLRRIEEVARLVKHMPEYRGKQTVAFSMAHEFKRMAKFTPHFSMDGDSYWVF